MTDQTQTTTERQITMVTVPRSAVERLILAADSYGVAHLDSDDMDDDATELQDATEVMKDHLTTPQPLAIGLDRAKTALKEADAGGGDRVEIDTDDLRSLLALAAPAEGWQGIETAPKDGTEIILATVIDGHVYDEPATGGWRGSSWEPLWQGHSVIEHQGDFGTDWRSFAPQPTHWMPLLPAPTGEMGA